MPTYPMLTPRRITTANAGRAALAYVERAEKLGAEVGDFPEVGRARALLGRVAEIEADAAALRSRDAAATVRATAARYAAGEVTMAEVVDVAAGLAPEANQTAMKIAEEAAVVASAAVVAELAKVGDRWITALRPVVASVLGPLASLARAIPPRVTDHMAARTFNVAVQWARLERLSADLEAVHDLADEMRMAGLIPFRPRPAEDYRWAHLDRLDGPNRDAAWFLVHNYRRGAGPAILTDAEVRAGLRATPLDAA